MSQHIKQLETELSVTLCRRDGREVTPTPAGTLYYKECLEVLEAAGYGGGKALPVILSAVRSALA